MMQTERNSGSLVAMSGNSWIYLFSLKEENDRHEAQSEDRKSNCTHAVVNFNVVTDENNSVVAFNIDDAQIHSNTKKTDVIEKIGS